jgi:hypothetical protein
VRARSWGAKHQRWIKRQVNYIESSEKGEIGKIAIGRLRKKVNTQMKGLR